MKAVAGYKAVPALKRKMYGQLATVGHFRVS